MIFKHYFLLASAIVLATAGGAIAQQTATIKPAVQAHIDAANKAGDEFGVRMCDSALPTSLRPKRTPATNDELRMLYGIPGQLQKPVRLFDNMYYLGVRTVTSYAINTSAGIILIDTLDNTAEAKSQIEGGLKTLGLDPSQIKYIIVTHGHGDHFGGAKYLADKYHAHILMSDADWKFMAAGKSNPKFDAPPQRDMTITDGQKLTLGDETLTLYITPGHTPGTVSMLIPVKDRGNPHLVALWGGTGPTNATLYAQSADRFESIALAAGADAPFSNHPEVDRVLKKIAVLEKRGANDPNPFVMGSNSVRTFLTTLSECAKAKTASLAN
jgi:metallo-beta-lactamase class B